LNLWNLQEFSLEKITLLVDMTQQQVIDTIIDHLHQEHGKTKEEAIKIVEAYRSRFPALPEKQN